jgi:hypothetical protein
MNRRLSRQPRRAFAAVMAMLYLSLFTVLAIGFYAAAAVSLQIAGNDQAAFDAQAAAESGLQFVKYQLGRIELPACADDESSDDDLSVIASLLAKQLDGSPNMNGHGVVAVEHVIYLPAADDFISLDSASHARFQAQITWHGQSPSVKVIGSGENPSIVRALRMDFEKQDMPGGTAKFVPIPGTYEEVTP